MGAEFKETCQNREQFPRGNSIEEPLSVFHLKGQGEETVIRFHSASIY